MTLARLIRFLFAGSDEQTMSRAWRAQHMPRHEAWTVRQLEQGSITKDSAWFRRAEFWRSREKPQLRIVRVGERA